MRRCAATAADPVRIDRKAAGVADIVALDDASPRTALLSIIGIILGLLGVLLLLVPRVGLLRHSH